MFWFRRKPANRRLGREHVLDVKLRSSKLRAARARMLALGLSSCFLIVLIGYLGYRLGDWALDEFVYRNKAFQVQEVDIQTDGVVALDQLRRWAGVRAEDNLLALDLGQIQRNLERIPVIRRVSIERVFPHALRIRVIEREPVLQAFTGRPRAGGGIDPITLFIDSLGYVMLPLEPWQRAPDAPPMPDKLPVLSGRIDMTELQPGRRVDSPQVRAALELIAAFDRSPMAGIAEVTRIDISGLDSLVLTTAQGSEITFGLNDHARQLSRWRRVFDKTQEMGKLIASLDLAITNHIPMRLLDPSGAPVQPPKPIKAPNTRKRHV